MKKLITTAFALALLAVVFTGCLQKTEDQTISRDSAIKIVEEYASCSIEEYELLKAELDDGQSDEYYEIEFVKDGVKHKYDVNVKTGKVREHVESAEKTEFIGKDEAVRIALEHAKLTEAEVERLECEIDDCRDGFEYEIEFVFANTEYEYEIDAYTGEIKECETEPVRTPAATRPDETMPDETRPDETRPDETRPDETRPEETRPDETRPDETVTVPEPPKHIGINEAKRIAAEHAGVDLALARFERVELEHDDGVVKYEVEFRYGRTEYEYDIEAFSGRILSFEHDTDDDTTAPPLSPDDGEGIYGPSVSFIGADKAKKIALEHSGVDASRAIFEHVEFDVDDGVAMYEVEFYAGYTEYDYEIDAISGKVLSVDRDAEHIVLPEPELPSGERIGEKAALNAALKKLGLKESDVYDVECEFEIDDGMAVYEVEFMHGRIEYDFLIDAYTGKVIIYEYEIDD